MKHNGVEVSESETPVARASGGGGGAWLWFFVGAATGALAAFLLDPAQGRGRRALIRDKGLSYSRKSMEVGGRVGRDLTNRAKGIVSQVSGSGNIPKVGNDQSANVPGGEPQSDNKSYLQ